MPKISKRRKKQTAVPQLSHTFVLISMQGFLRKMEDMGERIPFISRNRFVRTMQRNTRKCW